MAEQNAKGKLELCEEEVTTPIRVTRPVDTRSVKRQLDHERETLTSDGISKITDLMSWSTVGTPSSLTMPSFI
jgi:hypothetical protein